MMHGHRPMSGHRHFRMGGMTPPPPPPGPFMRWRRPYIPGGGCCGCGGCMMSVVGTAVFVMMMLTYLFF